MRVARAKVRSAGKANLIEGPLVSIISPTYNHGKFIRQCIESVLAQTYPDWEQIVIDDGSTDDTVGIVRQICDARIRLITQPHQGITKLAETYDSALRAARGDFIAILEGDDFWPPDKLATLVPAFADPNVVLAYGLTRVVRSNGTLTGQTIPSTSDLRRIPQSVFTNSPMGNAVPAMLLTSPGLFTYPCAVIFRRSALEALGGFQTVGDHHAVDWATCINLALRGSFAFRPVVMGYWRRYASSINSSGRLEEFWREDYHYLMQFALRHRGELNLSDATLHHMERSWQRLWTRLWRTQARHMLLGRDWGEARKLFLKALLRTDIPAGKVISTIGIVGSVIHKDIEWIWRLGNRAALTDEPPVG